MERYSDLTHQELIALTEEDIERLIDIEIAHEGIMPVACPVVPSIEAEGIVATEIAYEIGSLLFKNEQDALAVSKMDRFTSAYEYSCGGYDFKWLEAIVEGTVTKKTFYKQSDVVRIKEILQRNKTKRDQYNKAKNAYDKFLSATGKIRDAVYSCVHEARNIEEEFTQARAVLEKYRTLAAGDEAIAIGFFKNTYKDRLDILQEVIKEH